MKQFRRFLPTTIIFFLAHDLRNPLDVFDTITPRAPRCGPETMWFKMTKTKQGPSESSSDRTVTPTGMEHALQRQGKPAPRQVNHQAHCVQGQNFNCWVAATGSMRPTSESDSEDSKSDEGLWMMSREQREQRALAKDLKAWRKGRFDAWIDSVGELVKTGEITPIMYMTKDGVDTFPRTWYEEFLDVYEEQIEAKEVKPEWDTMIPLNVNNEELPAWSDSEDTMTGLCMGCRFTVIIETPSEELAALFAEDNCEDFSFHTDHMDLEEMIRSGERGMSELGVRKLDIDKRNAGLEWDGGYETYERWTDYAG